MKNFTIAIIGIVGLYASSFISCMTWAWNQVNFNTSLIFIILNIIFFSIFLFGMYKIHKEIS